MKAYRLCLTFCFTVVAFGQVVSDPVKNVIIVPVLVEGKSGEIAYDLAASDFSVKDEGVEQRVMLEDNSQPPLSLVLVIQTGHGAAAQLDKIGRLDDLLDSFLTGPGDQAAVVTFDSSASLLLGFTAKSDSISRSLSSLAPGNAGAALFDALSMAVKLLRDTPASNSRVILLISREHDHGSTLSDAGSVVRGIASEGISIYSLTGVAGKKELLTKLRSLNPLQMNAGAMQRNVPEAVAQLSGGDFYRFSSERDFEDRTTKIATHVHNRYRLSFLPSAPSPGYHSIQVQVLRSSTNVVAARSAYWVLTGAGPQGSETAK